MSINDVHSTPAPEIVHTEYAFSLSASQGLAALVNPDFLRYNDIVPSDWIAAPPFIIERESSDIEFTNGVGVRARGNQITFAFNTADSSVDNVNLSMAFAIRFIRSVPGIRYHIVGIDVRGYAMFPIGSPGIMNIGTRFQGVLPVITHRASYTFPDRDFTFWAEETGEDDEDQYVDRLELRTRNTYDFQSSQSGQAPPDIVLSIAADWERYIDEFDEVASNFLARHVSVGEDS